MAKKERNGWVWAIGGVILCLVPTGMGGAFAVGAKSEVLKSRFAIEDAMNKKNWDELVKSVPKSVDNPKYMNREEVREWIRSNVEPHLKETKWSVNVKDEHISNHDKGSFSFGFGYERFSLRPNPDLPFGIPTPEFGHESVFRIYVYQHNIVVGKTLEKEGLAKFPYDCEVIAPKDRFQMGEFTLRQDGFLK